jgi:hypothetical protein
VSAINWIRKHPRITVGAIVVFFVIGSIENLTAAKVPGPTAVPSTVAQIASPTPSPSATPLALSPTPGATPSVTPTATPTAQVTDTPEPTDTPDPTDTPVPKKLFLSFTGSGIKTSKKFSDPDFTYAQFEIVWSYDCSAGFGTGTFIVDWYDDSSDLPDGLTNELGKKGHDVTYEYNDVNGGPYHIEVNSECKWSVKVYGVPD